MVTYQGLIPDAQYLNILKEILESGCSKNTRAGEVLSVFGKTMRFDLSKGHIPLLTTKKVFTKSVIHELLWFISGDTNIRYLVKNGVHIWVDDAYRHYKTLVSISNNKARELNNQNYCAPIVDCEVLPKCDFVKKVYDSKELQLLNADGDFYTYHYGDMGNIYGHQWRHWDKKDGTFVDQLKNIIETLKTNPDDRRMILTAWNVGELESMGLPPCHFCCEFYTAPVEEEYEEYDGTVHEKHHCYEQFCDCHTQHRDERRATKKRKLYCLLNCRSQDFMLGTPFNIASYAIFTRIIAQCVGMDCGELIWVGGDCHVYKNQIEGAFEQLGRDAYRFNPPTLQIDSDITDIDSFKFENFHISDYYCYPTIKMPLSVGDDDCNCNK